MKKFLLAAAASSALISAPAFADASDDSTLLVTAEVQPECSIEGLDAKNFGDLSINEEPGANALLLSGEQADPGTDFTWVSCNYGTTITLSSQNGGLMTESGDELFDQADFTNMIDYRLVLTNNRNGGLLPTVRLITNGEDSDSALVGGAFHEEAEVNIDIFNGDNAKRPIAGDYTDVATITLGPVI